MELKIKKLSPSSKVPTYSYDGDAAFDLCTNEDVSLLQGEFFAVPTGIAMEIEKGFAGLIWDKSGISIKNGVKVLGGVIDSGYRGEVKVGIINLGKEVFEIKVGDKVAQMIIQKVEHPEIILADELSQSERGENGFGSSGK